MTDAVINDLYDRLSKILKNDQQYPHTKVGGLIVSATSMRRGIEAYFDAYPPLLDIAELGAALEYEGSSHHDELLTQISYKMSQLRMLLPDVS